MHGGRGCGEQCGERRTDWVAQIDKIEHIKPTQGITHLRPRLRVAVEDVKPWQGGRVKPPQRQKRGLCVMQRGL